MLPCPQKQYYTIGEVATLLQLTRSAIRFWEKELPMLQPKKNKNGCRQYTPAHIKQLHYVYHLIKEQGYTLQGVKKILHQPPPYKTLLQGLKDLKAFLVTLQNTLTAYDHTS